MKEVVSGIDIGGTNTVIGLVDRSGNVLAQKIIKTTDYPEIKEFVSAMVSNIYLLIDKIPGIKLAGIGIGAPDANYNSGTIEQATNLVWKGIVPLVKYVKEITDVPVAITNDAKAAAMGEMIFGGAKGMKNFIILTLGTGLGSGIVVNGEVVSGHSGFAGEIGQTIVVPGGRDCGCGRQGCLETYASASGLVRTALNLLSEMNEESSLRDIPPSQLTSKIIAEEALKNDPVALEAMDYTAEMLGFGIANTIVFTSPEAIFLFGGLAQAGEALFEPVREYTEKNVMPVFKGTYKILPSAIPESNAAVLGAAALAWDELK